MALAALLGLVGAACSRQPTSPPPPQGSIAALKQGADRVSLVQAQSHLTTGPDVFTFGLLEVGEVVAENFLTGGEPEVWVAKDEASRAMGPFPATWLVMDAYERSGDRSPRTPFPGFYAAELDIPAPGIWTIAAVATTEESRAVGVGFMEVKEPAAAVAAVGSPAIQVRTPVAHSEEELPEVCTRDPPDPMHYISVDEAFSNGKPTVITFATPLLCTSRMCGPVVDEVLVVYQKIGPDVANFIHVELFLPGPDLRPPSATQENMAPAYRRWRFETEPWTVVIDGEGIIRARFEGPVAASQIEAALRPLLAAP